MAQNARQQLTKHTTQMLPLVTTRIKDIILVWLCSTARLGQIAQVHYAGVLAETGLDVDALLAVLEDFEEMGLIESLISTRGHAIDIILALKVKAHTLFQSGGFVIIDALNEANMQKILFELKSLEKQLKPDQMEALNKIASIASSIATVLVAFSGKDQ